MLQDVSRHSIATGFFADLRRGSNSLNSDTDTLDISILVTHCISYILITQGYPQRMTLHYKEDL